MRKFIYALALLAFATPLFASDPYVGTWTLNQAKTKYTTGTAPKDVTVMVVQQGKNFQVTITGTRSDGSPIAAKYTIPVNGGAATVQQGDFDAVKSKRVDANTRDNSFMKDGKEIRTRHQVISSDGKTMTSTVKGVDSAGNPVEGDDVFDKK
jgi:hypothetical protein